MRLQGLAKQMGHWDAVVLILLLGASGCEESTIGQPCGTMAEPITDPVGGEVPVVEVVRLERDGACHSFQCLTHRGLAPYCTRTCALNDPPKKQKSCTVDEDCTGGSFADGAEGHCLEGKCVCEEDTECETPLQCADGQCRDDDCPEGYWCKTVQEVGPLQDQRYCVHRDQCQTNSDCEAFGVMKCQHLGCFDALLRGYLQCRRLESAACDELGCYALCVPITATDYYCPESRIAAEDADACRSAGCFATDPDNGPCFSVPDFHRLVCEPIDNLRCECSGQAATEQPGGTDACLDAEMQCQPDSARDPWATGAVHKLNVCQEEE